MARWPDPAGGRGRSRRVLPHLRAGSPPRGQDRSPAAPVTRRPRATARPRRHSGSRQELRRDIPKDDPQPRQAEADRAGDRGEHEEGRKREDETTPHRPQPEPEPAPRPRSRRADVKCDDPGTGRGGNIRASLLAARRRERHRRSQVAEGSAEGLVRDRVERLPRLSHGSAPRSRPRAVRGAGRALATASISRSPAGARESPRLQPRTGRGSSAPR